jgi:putative tryptophan/tyrosine transport system substrate-binding protein
MMRRRAFITLLGGAAAWPLAVRAQEPGRTYRLGVLHQLPRTASQFARLFDGLRRQGFIEGRILVDPRGFGSSAQQYQERVAEKRCAPRQQWHSASLIIRGRLGN